MGFSIFMCFKFFSAVVSKVNLT